MIWDIALTLFLGIMAIAIILCVIEYPMETAFFFFAFVFGLIIRNVLGF